jgi:hypothetical protein
VRCRHLLTALAVIVACEEAPEANVERGDASCVLDPMPRIAYMHDCSHTGDCPSGMRCAERRCELDVGVDVSTSVLTSGFNVPRFDLTVVGPGEFTFNTPQESQFVTCVSFRCVPEFEGRPARITNFDSCAVGADYFSGKEPSVSVADLTPVTPLPLSHADQAALDAACGDRRDEWLARPRATGAWFGCWAYGEASVLRATRFLDVSADAAFLEVLDECPSCDLVGRSGCESRAREEGRPKLHGYGGCWLPEGGVGACLNGHCTPWCLEDSDCTARAQCEQDGAPRRCTPICKEVEDSVLGLCAVPTEPE